MGALRPSPPAAPRDAPLSLQLGLTGRPPLETDCLLLLSIWLELRLSSTMLFVARLPLVTHHFPFAFYQDMIHSCMAPELPSGPSTSRGFSVQ